MPSISHVERKDAPEFEIKSPFDPPLPFQSSCQSCAQLAVLAAICEPNALRFLVCKYTEPGPKNRQARPSPEARLENIPPEATRSILYWQFQATR